MGSAATAYHLDDFKKDRCHQNGKTVLGLTKRAAFVHPTSQVKTIFPPKERAKVKPACDINTGVSTKLFECRRDKCDSVYLCGRCSLKITEEDIVGHVADLNHQKMRRVVFNLGEKTYNSISKQGFHSAFHTLKALNLTRNSVNKRSSTFNRPANSSAARHVQPVSSMMDNFEDEIVEVTSPADVGTVMHMPMTKTHHFPTSSNAAQTRTFVKLSKSADSLHGYQSDNRGKQAFKMSSKGYHNIRLLPYSRGNCFQYVNPIAICKPVTAPPKIRSPVASLGRQTTSKCTKTASTLTGSTSSAAFSKVVPTSITVPMSRTLERENAAASKSASFNVARDTEVQESTCRADPFSRQKNALRCAETATSASNTFQNKVTFTVTPEAFKHGAENANASKMAQMKNSLRANATVGPHAKRNPSAAPHPKIASSTASEHKMQHKESSHASAGTKPNGNHHKVGLNQLIIVSSEGKQQVYCQLCSVRLKRSDHPFSFSHQYNYVKRKYPGWTATPAELESKLSTIVAHLAEVERNLGSQNAQKVEVKKDLYQKLALLPEDKAVERVKAMVRQRDPRVSLSEDTAEVFRQEVTSPYEVSSSDDVLEVSIPHCEMPGLSKSQLMQEAKTERQKLLEQITEMKSRLTTKNDLAVYQAVRGRHLDGEYTKVVAPIQDQLQASITLNKKQPLPIPAASSQVEVIAEAAKHEPSEPEGDAEPHSEVILVAHTPVAKVEKADEHAGNPENKQEWKSCPASLEPQKDLESKQKSTPCQINSPNPEAATVGTEQLDLSAPRHSAGPTEPKTSQAFTVTSAGRIIQGSSHLSIFLKASQHDAKPVIGMGLVWECRGMSLETFFLCESCEKTLSCRDICQHMVSLDHQLKYIWREHPEFLRMFWNDADLPSNEKLNIVKLIVKELSERERFHKVDAQCVLLGKELHQFVKTSSFCEALKIVCDMKDEEKPSIISVPTNTKHQSSQQPEDCHKLFLKEQVTQTCVTDHRCETKLKTEMLHPEKTSTVGGLEVKGVSSQLDVNSSVKVESVSSVSIVGTSLTPQETYNGLYLQPQFKPAVSRLSKSDPPLHVKQEAAYGSTAFASVGSMFGQNPEVFSRNEGPPSRKRPADEAEDPLQAKCVSSPAQVKGEPSSQSVSLFPSVNPAVNSASLSIKYQETGTSKSEPSVNWKLFAELISKLKKSNFQVQMSPSGSVLENPVSSCSSSSSGTVASRWDSKVMKTKSESVLNKRWDSKCLLVEATVKKTNSNSLEGMKTEAPVDLE